MRKSIKIGLIVCISVIAVLGLAVGMMPPAKTVNNPIALNNSSNDTTTVNDTLINTSNDAESTTNEGASMTPEQAIEIVNNELYPYYQATSAVLVDGTPNPVYLVHIIHITPNTYGKDGGNVTVDSITGFVEHKGV